MPSGAGCENCSVAVPAPERFSENSGGPLSSKLSKPASVPAKTNGSDRSAIRSTGTSGTRTDPDVKSN